MATPDRPYEKRPDPQALLQLAGREHRGRLTIFLGAAPGVGKTYAMLARARRLMDEGQPVMIGLVETHGRKETMALTEGLPCLPRRRISCKGRELEEFDLDAALNLRPRLLIVDELAHSNAPDCRHPKRYQDVEELVDAGIDVWTALNVQHLESLSDVVARITGVIVRETVPDVVLKKADEVILVDITPDELIERLKAGKVYLPDNARRAADGFFRPGNLTALRELALRRTADRVDDQMIDYLRRNAIDGPWASGERLLVCIGADAMAAEIIRAASRLAESMNADWLVLHLRHPEEDNTSSANEKYLADALALAERLGAETRQMTARDFVSEIMNFARVENMTQIVVGRSKRSFLAGLFPTSLPDRVLRKVQGIGIHVISGDPERQRAASPRQDWKPAYKSALIWLRDGAIIILTIAAAAGLGVMLRRFGLLANSQSIFVMAVLFLAVSLGRAGGAIGALLAGLVYNLILLPPYGTLDFDKPQFLSAMVTCAGVAILAGDMASRMRARALRARRREQETEALFRFSRKLAATSSSHDIAWATASELRTLFPGDVLLLLPKDGELVTEILWPPDLVPETNDLMAARWAMEKAEPAGRGTGTLPQIRLHFRPLVSPRGAQGVAGFSPPDRLPLMSAEEERVLSAILDQAAIALERSLLEGRNARVAEHETQARQSRALLASVTHDLRQPVDRLLAGLEALPASSARSELVAEARNLKLYLAAMGELDRLEAGELNARNEPLNIAALIAESVARARTKTPEREIEVSCAADLPPLRADARLLRQVLANLLENADRFGGAETATSVYARSEPAHVVISITDQGRPVPADDLEKLFERFYRRKLPDGTMVQAGLSLAICKGLTEAMGGTIRAESPAIRRRGTRIVLRFPRSDKA